MPKIRIDQLIIPKFDGLLFDVLDHGHTHYTLTGGRGSTKSSFIGLVIPLLITQHRDAHAVVFRRYSNTLRDSVYSQISFGITLLGMDHLFKRTVSPMEMTYIPTGQKILFRGLDEPEKIKSIKAPFGYFGITWFEELDQIRGREEVRKVLQSTMRGEGGIFWNFESFNPPISRSNWANMDLLIERPDRLITRSSYLDVPRNWLSPQFFEEAEFLRETNLRAYQHEYMGEAVGTGGQVFDQLKLRRIDDRLIRSFDRIRQGVDWGWFPDPYAFIRLHYDKARETIYIIDEIYVNKKSNEETAKLILDRKYDDAMITCDSAEPKSSNDYRRMNLRARDAVKGPGSVEYGMKWLQRRLIVIDPKRTPNAAREFQNYEYERDRDGNTVSGYPDESNHTIDATRYALEDVIHSNKTIA